MLFQDRGGIGIMPNEISPEALVHFDVRPLRPDKYIRNTLSFCDPTAVELRTDEIHYYDRYVHRVGFWEHSTSKAGKQNSSLLGFPWSHPDMIPYLPRTRCWNTGSFPYTKEPVSAKREPQTVRNSQTVNNLAGCDKKKKIKPGNWKPNIIIIIMVLGTIHHRPQTAQL